MLYYERNFKIFFVIYVYFKSKYDFNFVWVEKVFYKFLFILNFWCGEGFFL